MSPIRGLQPMIRFNSACHREHYNLMGFYANFSGQGQKNEPI